MLISEYVRWSRVDEYLDDFGFLPQVANEENPHDYYIEHSNVTKMCELCRDKDIAIVNGKEYSNDLLEYSEVRGNPNLTVISESGLYRILAKCNLPKCDPDVDVDEEQRIYDALKEKGAT